MTIAFIAVWESNHETTPSEWLNKVFHACDCSKCLTSYELEVSINCLAFRIFFLQNSLLEFSFFCDFPVSTLFTWKKSNSLVQISSSLLKHSIMLVLTKCIFTYLNSHFYVSWRDNCAGIKLNIKIQHRVSIGISGNIGGQYGYVLWSHSDVCRATLIIHCKDKFPKCYQPQ